MTSRRGYRIVLVAIVAGVAIVVAAGVWCLRAPLPDRPSRLDVEVLNLSSVPKRQGGTHLCWAYAMLAAVEADRLRLGDTLDLPIGPVVAALAAEGRDPATCRAMAPTLLSLARRHGLYDSLCGGADFVALCSQPGQPYGRWVVPDYPDNWERHRMLNLHPDTLLALAERAVRQGRGVCWEGDVGSRGFSFEQGLAVTLLPPFLLRCKAALRPPADGHCLSLEGLVRDDEGVPYFVAKNSWGADNPYGGRMLMSFSYFRWNTVAVVVPRAVLPQQLLRCATQY